MAILYALVARGSTVLAEFDAAHGNAKTIARQILEKIPGTGDSHVCYSQDRYIFHVKRTDGLTVLCMADDTAGRRIPFAFLEDIHGKFVKTYGRAVHTALAFTMNDEFSRILSQQMEYYSSDPNADKINRIRGEMSQVRNVMVENIDKVLERGDRLELLVDKTDAIQGNTFRFKKQARRFKNTIWWRNVKLTTCTWAHLQKNCISMGSNFISISTLTWNQWCYINATQTSKWPGQLLYQRECACWVLNLVPIAESAPTCRYTTAQWTKFYGENPIKGSHCG